MRESAYQVQFPDNDKDCILRDSQTLQCRLQFQQQHLENYTSTKWSYTDPTLGKRELSSKFSTQDLHE